MVILEMLLLLLRRLLLLLLLLQVVLLLLQRSKVLGFEVRVEGYQRLKVTRSRHRLLAHLDDWLLHFRGRFEGERDGDGEEWRVDKTKSREIKGGRWL